MVYIHNTAYFRSVMYILRYFKKGLYESLKKRIIKGKGLYQATIFT